MLIILVVFSLLGWIYLTQASHVATTGRRVQELEDEKARLQEGNLELMVEIARLESVTRLASQARELGFATVSAEDAEFLFVADQTADPGQPADDSSLAARWWDGIAAQFATWVRTDSP
jgi:hypothetical protein